MPHGSHAKAGRRADAVRWTDAALRERVKELTCLYGIAVVAQQPDTPLEEILQSIVELLPAAWQYPEIASAKLTLDGCSYVTAGSRECLPKQSAPIVINGKRRGVVEVGYAETRPKLDEGPFLKEER
ncbi:MAG: sensor histidine kinase, partial [Planctomycetota bacterium]